MAVWFVSDLHLEPARPQGISDFAAFCTAAGERAESVYILGDLFEAWIGDDDDDPGLRPILDALTALTGGGTACFFMHGNRDFLVGEAFCARTGCRLLDEFATIDINGEPLLLTHGDLLCTDDVRYLELRQQLRDAEWQRDFLSKPLPERRSIAADLRQLSQTEMAAKSESIMDVNEQAVRATMRRFGVQRLLHGHTHRPAVHRFDLDGASAVRVVLNDWYGPGGFVSWDESGPEQHSLHLRALRSP
jgi:UDP-2,3-diacylglucosamine hydrolase